MSPLLATAATDIDRRNTVAEKTVLWSDARCAGDKTFQSLLNVLDHAFAQPFCLVNIESGDLIHSDHDALSCDLFSRMELLAEVARRGKPEIVEEVAPLSLLAIPLTPLSHKRQVVAVGVFVHQAVDSEMEISAAANALGVNVQRALSWAAGREVWSQRALLRLAESTLDNLMYEGQVKHLREEINEAVAHARDTYIELGLLHRLTRHLDLSENEAELWQNVLVWVAEAVPAQCLAIVVNRDGNDEAVAALADDVAGVLIHGECPTEQEDLYELLKRFGSRAVRQPLAYNREQTSLPSWPCPTVRELVCVPISDGDRPWGWLIGLNHKGRLGGKFGRFGSVEIRLMTSVCSMLGMHASNSYLYQKQSDLFASSVRALTSAIDAKDGYTAGHSDRVARVSVALARHLGLDAESIDTIYLAGLLHDIGKIGIDDQVLNKPGRLTDEEFEHIKLHPQLGYEILKGVRQLEKVLPMVLHHHEAWDGSGYPHGLKGEETPRMARIMAVADAFDAMSSDRPYRKGMPDEKLDAILRDGAGKQWDAEVVEAFFAIRDEIRKVSQAETDVPLIDGKHWVK